MARHRFKGDEARFQVLADYIAEEYGKRVRYIADVAGGQGMLARILAKKYNYSAEVIDVRGWALKGVLARQECFSPDLAGYYDLIVGLHPDEATRAVAESAVVKPTILVPCCNFWSNEKLGQEELLEAIESYYRDKGVVCKRVEFAFRGPKNIGLISNPS